MAASSRSASSRTGTPRPLALYPPGDLRRGRVGLVPAGPVPAPPPAGQPPPPRPRRPAPQPLPRTAARPRPARPPPRLATTRISNRLCGHTPPAPALRPSAPPAGHRPASRPARSGFSRTKRACLPPVRPPQRLLAATRPWHPRARRVRRTSSVAGRAVPRYGPDGTPGAPGGAGSTLSVADDQGGAARIGVAQGGQDVRGRFEPVARDCLGGGAQGGGDGHLVALGHPQPGRERADHAGEAGRSRRARPPRRPRRAARPPPGPRPGPAGRPGREPTHVRRCGEPWPVRYGRSGRGGQLVGGGQLATVLVPRRTARVRPRTRPGPGLARSRASAAETSSRSISSRAAALRLSAAPTCSRSRATRPAQGGGGLGAFGQQALGPAARPRRRSARRPRRTAPGGPRPAARSGLLLPRAARRPDGRARRGRGRGAPARPSPRSAGWCRWAARCWVLRSRSSQRGQGEPGFLGPGRGGPGLAGRPGSSSASRARALADLGLQGGPPRPARRPRPPRPGPGRRRA